MRSRKQLKRLGIILATLVAMWLLSSAVVTWKLTHRGQPPFAEPAAKFTWAAVEDHRLTTVDGQKIGAWLARGAPDRGCVLLLHGNGASRTALAGVMRILVAEGLTVMSISLRAHGDSTGEVNDFGFGARHEVVEAVRFLESQFPVRPIIVVGRSLGAAAALFAADELGDRVAGYILEQPYNDLSSATFNRLQSHLPPPLDWVAYGGMRCVSLVLLPVDLKEIAPANCLSSIPAARPITILTGSADPHARLSEVRAMHRQVAGHARLIVFDGAAHIDLDVFDPVLYKQVLLEAVSQP